ncbi:MAG: uncharacterized protein A8A55_0807 [Amphiamblys sp. WSBS2006]|nr:MAG: uncharacterized protein A8A55_0807 [Amphiamblys sp. WSBS2006]
MFFRPRKRRSKEEGIRDKGEAVYAKHIGNTVFIPVIKIEVDCCTENWGWFEEITGIHFKTDALAENNIDHKIKQKIGEMITQKETVVKKEFGYQKLVFEEDSKHREQRETGESNEQPSTGFQAFKEDYSLLEGTPDMHMLEENDCFHDEEVIDPFWNRFLEGRS